MGFRIVRDKLPKGRSYPLKISTRMEALDQEHVTSVETLFFRLRTYRDGVLVASYF